jgi:hypothetical protein
MQVDELMSVFASWRGLSAASYQLNIFKSLQFEDASNPSKV